MHSCANSDSFYGKNTLRTLYALLSDFQPLLWDDWKREYLPTMIMYHIKNTGAALAIKCMSFEGCSQPHFLHKVKMCTLMSLSKFLTLLWSDHGVYGFRCCCSKIETHWYLNSASCRIEIVTPGSQCISVQSSTVPDTPYFSGQA